MRIIRAVLSMVLAGALLGSQMGLGGNRAAAQTPAPVCATANAQHRIPGLVLTGPRFGGIISDDATKHVFVLSDGSYDQTGRHVCATGVLTLDASSGRVIHVTALGHGTGPASANWMAVSGPAHRLFAVDWGRIADPLSHLPELPGSLYVLDTRSGRLAGVIPFTTHPGPVAVDVGTYRAFVVAATNEGATVTSTIDVVAVTRGKVLRTIQIPGSVTDIAVDQHRNRVFLIDDGLVTTLDGATGRVLATATLPSQYHAYNGNGIDQRTGLLYVSEYGAAPPHSGLNGNPPSTISLIDTATGNLVRTVTEGHGILAGRMFVDEPAGIVLSWEINTDATSVTVLDARDGSLRRSLVLPLPRNGFNGPMAADPRTGEIFGYTYRGVRAISPGRWSQVRVVSTRPAIEPLGLSLSVSTGRVYALQIDNPPPRYSVSAYCLRPSCR